MEELLVEPRQPLADPRANDEAYGDADDRDQQHQLHVVHGDGELAVAQRLEQADLLAFERDHARQRHVDEKGRHEQEDRRHDTAQRIELAQLRVKEGVAQLVFACDGPRAAVAREPVIDGLDRLGLRRAWHQLDRHVVEGAIKIEQRSERLLGHPDDGEAPVVGHQIAGAKRVDEFRRQRETHDLERPLAAVDECLEGAAEPHLVRKREGFVDGHLVRMLPRRQAPLAQVHAVEAGRLEVRDREHAARGGLGQAFDVEECQLRDARFGRSDARDLLQPLADQGRRTPDLGEDVGEIVELVVGPARLVQRAIGAARHHEGRDAGGHHQCDGERLRPHAQEITDEFAIEHPHHQVSSAGCLRTVLT